MRLKPGQLVELPPKPTPSSGGTASPKGAATTHPSLAIRAILGLMEKSREI